jgi:hypothetical protein
MTCVTAKEIAKHIISAMRKSEKSAVTSSTLCVTLLNRSEKFFGAGSVLSCIPQLGFSFSDI